QVSWLTSLLHADILSSRFDQQANSPGSWTKLALKPLLLKRIQNASLETCVPSTSRMRAVSPWTTMEEQRRIYATIKMVLVLKSDSQWIPRCPATRPPHGGAGTSPAEEEGKL
ncbi:NPC intracellular cholesterol transporter 1-like protein 2, partial [Frankliniella fusca]